MSEWSPEGEALTNLVVETFRLNGVLLEIGNRMTEPYGLTSARWQVMGAIRLAERPQTVAQVARRMGLARQGVQRIVGDLHRLGMITLETNPDHKRAPLMSVTDEGEATLTEIDKAQVEWVNELAEGLSKRRIDQALRILETLRVRSEQPENER